MKPLTTVFSKLTALCVISLALTACATPSQVYWDAKVKEMCEKDGGVTVYEKVELTKEQYDSLPKYEKKYVTVLIKELVKKDQEYFSESTTTTLHESNPYVRKVDVFIKRKYDEKTIAKYSTFHRRGGDLAAIDNPSFYSCPDPKLIAIKVNEIFSIKGDSK